MLQLRRWCLMLTGKSIWHVNQDIGKCFSVDAIRGYYNNMTEKVTKLPNLLENNRLPLLNTGTKEVEMPVAIFQYGLGAYDLYLQTGENRYMKKFNQTVKWAIEHQDKDGRWNTFFYIYPENPYGAMAQGEGASLLLRAYVQTGDEKYLEVAQKAIDYMTKSIEKGGTTIYDKDNVVFAEYTHLPIVMNGWIFALWGLYDYVLATKDEGQYRELLSKSCETLIKYLPQFKTRYWSKYDLAGMIASPFYHNLHIAQMQAMYQLTGKSIFDEYAKRWEEQQSKVLNKGLALFVKAIQKLKEKE